MLIMIKYLNQKIKKIMWFCNCPSGESLINPCAHISAMLFLIYVSQKCDLKEWTKQSKRDAKIFETVIDITAESKKFIKEKWPKKYCKCNKIYDGEYTIECEVCSEWFHPPCINQSVESCEKEKDGWQCPSCQNPLNVINMFKF